MLPAESSREGASPDSFAPRSPSPSALSARSSPRTGGRRICVDVVAEEHEWACFVDSSSSASASTMPPRFRSGAPALPVRAGIPASGARAPCQDALDGSSVRGSPDGLVQVVVADGEWADMPEGSCSSSFQPPPRRSPPTGRRVQLSEDKARPLLPSLDTADEEVDEAALNRGVSRTSLAMNRRCRFFLAVTLRYIDLTLRVLTFNIWYTHKEFVAVACLLLSEVIGIAISLYVTFQDTDVRLWIARTRRKSRQRHCIVRVCMMCLLAGGLVLGCGCCQLIQDKRAYRRQMSRAPILRDFNDRTAADTEFGLAERGMPVMLIKACVFLTFNFYVQVAKPWAWATTHESWVLLMANIDSLIVLTWRIVDIDEGVSSTGLRPRPFVRRYASMDTSLAGSRLCRALRSGLRLFREASQICCWPAVHMATRCAEVCLRTLIVAQFIVVGQHLMGPVWTGILLFLEFLVHAMVLARNSPAGENCFVHIAAALLIEIFDVSFFVDRPSFVKSARRTSYIVGITRLTSVVCVFAMHRTCAAADAKKNTSGSQYWLFMLVASTATYYFLHIIWLVRHVRHLDDLHTASSVGDVDRVKEILEPDGSGRSLDVNDPAKDRSEKTPLMLAAERGHDNIVEVLLQLGADINIQTVHEEETCLHLAARNGHLSTCRLLTGNSTPDKPDMVLWRNERGEAAMDLVPSNLLEDVAQELRSVLSVDPGTPASPSMTPHGVTVDADLQAVSGSHRTRFGKRNSIRKIPDSRTSVPFYNVRAELCGERQLGPVQNQLNQLTDLRMPSVRDSTTDILFPTVSDDDTPSPRVLRSVSSLIISEAAGGLARKLLSREHSRRGDIRLGELRPGGTLGTGAFGRVTEVKLADGRRFALKFQKKSKSASQAQSEVQALRGANHPFIIRLERAFQTPKHFALLLEYCSHDLNHELCNNCETPEESGRYDGLEPRLAAKYMGQVLLALTHLHNQKYVFCDLKPKNILIAIPGEVAKLTDFGLARPLALEGEERPSDPGGTLGFRAPELSATSSTYQWTSKIDSYSFGVTLQLTLLGEDGGVRRQGRDGDWVMLPILGVTDQENLQSLETLRDSGRLSEEAFDLLAEKLLSEDPDRRCELRSLLGDAFFLRTLECLSLEELLFGHQPSGTRSSSSKTV